jgi:hypothetical protein
MDLSRGEKMKPPAPYLWRPGRVREKQTEEKGLLRQETKGNLRIVAKEFE